MRSKRFKKLPANTKELPSEKIENLFNYYNLGLIWLILIIM